MSYEMPSDSSTFACWCLDVCFQEEKEMAMSHRLEDLTTTVSDDPLPRREALRRLLGVVAGATLAVWLPEQVLARPGLIPNAKSGTWSRAGTMHIGRQNHTAALLTNGKVLVAGGLGDSGGYQASAELYDPNTSALWLPTGSMHTGRRYHTGTLLTTGKVLVTGGYGNSGVLASAELYDSRTGT